MIFISFSVIEFQCWGNSSMVFIWFFGGALFNCWEEIDNFTGHCCLFTKKVISFLFYDAAWLALFFFLLYIKVLFGSLHCSNYARIFISLVADFFKFFLFRNLCVHSMLLIPFSYINGT